MFVAGVGVVYVIGMQGCVVCVRGRGCVIAIGGLVVIVMAVYHWWSVGSWGGKGGGGSDVWGRGVVGVLSVVGDSRLGCRAFFWRVTYITVAQVARGWRWGTVVVVECGSLLLCSLPPFAVAFPYCARTVGCRWRVFVVYRRGQGRQRITQ